MDTIYALGRLAAELDSRGWRTTLRDDRLTVANPAAPRLNDSITSDGRVFRWAWGQGIGPVDEVPGAADRIVHVLRSVEP
ncbi:hypothetical protein E1200_18350 [Actinomadura sp. GC306]|uniref:hypothetical protein n=1 Tax=Actinomadura sp. GC306 TaxID=2530367 RepID=UPI00104D69AD|nr:hypothetical protein [Actinomadura sp. GC306]TDC65481.1 hypothetical protein E1200_18350 [Actinomadura sp. GC306]